MRPKQDWHKGIWAGDINILCVASVMEKECDPDYEDEPCIYFHYVIGNEKYLSYLVFDSDDLRDEFWEEGINDELLNNLIKYSLDEIGSS